MMRKLYIFGLIGLAAILIGLAWADEITLTTYYPAPYGVYKEMVIDRNLTNNIATVKGLLIDIDESGTNSGTVTGLGVDVSGVTSGTHYAATFQGGNVGIGTTSPTSSLQVVGLPEFLNNADAITGGLTVGAFYRSFGQDQVCVVH